MTITVLINSDILCSFLSLIFSFSYRIVKCETGRISGPTERQELLSMDVIEIGWEMNSYNRVLLLDNTPDFYCCPSQTSQSASQCNIPYPCDFTELKAIKYM